MILKVRRQDLDIGPLKLEFKGFMLPLTCDTATVATDFTGKTYREVRRGCLYLLWAREDTPPEVEVKACDW